MRLKTIQTGYMLGIGLLLTGIFYFFASNWQSFDRYAKIGLIIGLLLFFYLLHLLLRKTITHQHFLSNWMLVAANIVFGIALALVGQLYNSHADSYLLFLIWFIPVFALAIITKYIPFYIMSFVLAHLSIFTFMASTSYFPEWGPMELLLMYIGILLLNAILFYLCHHQKLLSQTIFYLSYSVFFGVFYVVTVSEDLPLFYLSNFIYIVLIAFCIYYWTKLNKQQPLLIITSIFAAIYVIYKVFYWVFENYGEWILLLLLGLSILLVLISVVTVGLLNRGKSNTFMIHLITISITVIATLFATIAIAGLFFILFPDTTGDILFFFAIFVLIPLGLFMKMSPQIRYTLLGTGFSLSFAMIFIADVQLYPYILLLLLISGLFSVQMKGIKVLIYILANMTATVIWFDLLSNDNMVFAMLLMNAGYYFIQDKERATRYTAFIIGLAFFMFSTFLDVHFWLLLLCNLGFFFMITLIVLLLNRDKYRFEWTVSLVFWFLFLIYKYYEYAWDLVHKSILCLILGVILIVLSYYMDRKYKFQKTTSKISYKLTLLLTIIVLQLGLIGYQSISNEYLLRQGTVIKLKIADIPIDTRSMIQGDYLILNYDINEINNDFPYENWNQNIQVVLREKEGFYTYSGYYHLNHKWNKTYEKQPGDVIMNGKIDHSNQIEYGIENYFISGKNDNDLDYVYVRVGKSGNAIIEKVE